MILGLFGVAYAFWTLGPRVLPASASEHGDLVDSMFNITTGVVMITFVITHIVLLSFAYLFRYKKDRQAYFFPHDNRLELIWTTIPAIVFTFLVFRGIDAWNEIFDFEKLETAEDFKLS